MSDSEPSHKKRPFGEDTPSLQLGEEMFGPQTLQPSDRENSFKVFVELVNRCIGTEMCWAENINPKTFTWRETQFQPSVDDIRLLDSLKCQHDSQAHRFGWEFRLPDDTHQFPSVLREFAFALIKFAPCGEVPMLLGPSTYISIPEGFQLIFHVCSTPLKSHRNAMLYKMRPDAALAYALLKRDVYARRLAFPEYPRAEHRLWADEIPFVWHSDTSTRNRLQSAMLRVWCWRNWQRPSENTWLYSEADLISQLVTTSLGSV